MSMSEMTEPAEVLEPADGEIANPAQAEEVLKLSVAVEPGFDLSPDICMLSDPRGPQAESIGALRAHMMAQHIRDGRRSLAICGPQSGVGTTFLAVNLAVAFAMAGTRALLIDGNLRSPGVQDMIRPHEAVRGLTDALTTQNNGVAEPLQREVMPNLSVIFAGGSSDNPQELLAGRGFKELVNEGIRQHDITIVDTPPASDFADYLRIAVVARYAMLVARKDHSRVPDIRHMTGLLSADRVAVVGSFLNEF